MCVSPNDPTVCLLSIIWAKLRTTKEQAHIVMDMRMHAHTQRHKELFP